MLNFQNFAYFLAFSRYTFQNLNQRLHGICSQPLHDPCSTKKNNIITSSMKLLSIKYHFWSILAVFLWTFFIGPPNTKKKCITDMLRFVRIHWYHFHWRIKNFFFFAISKQCSSHRICHKAWDWLTSGESVTKAPTSLSPIRSGWLGNPWEPSDPSSQVLRQIS